MACPDMGTPDRALPDGPGSRARAADRGARAAARRVRDLDARHRPAARLPADGPDRNSRDAAAARALQPHRPLRHRRARPFALEEAEALRVRRVHLPGRGPADHPRPDGEVPSRQHAQARALASRLSEDERALPAPRAARARTKRAAALAPAPTRPDARKREPPLVGN